MPTSKSEKLQGKIEYKSILTLQTFLYKSMSAFFLETSISENMSDLKGRGCVLT